MDPDMVLPAPNNSASSATAAEDTMAIDPTNSQDAVAIADTSPLTSPHPASPKPPSSELSPSASSKLHSDYHLSVSAPDLSENNDDSAVDINSFADGPSTSASSPVDALSPPDSSVATRELSPSVSPEAEHSNGKKNKSQDTLDLMEQAMQDPNLWGLRRTGRARQPPKETLEVPQAGHTRGRKRSSQSLSNPDTDFEEGEGNFDSDDEEPVRKRRKRPVLPVPKTKLVPLSYNSSRRGSDSDEYGSARNKVASQKARRKKTAPDNHFGDIRFSTRNAAKVATYNEDDDDEADLLDDEDNLYRLAHPSTAADSSVEEGPSIHRILNHRPKDGKTIDASADAYDFEYYVKWTGRAHYHSTWMDWADVRSYDSNGKRSENYYKKWVDLYIEKVAGEHVPEGEREEFLMKFDERANEIKQHSQIERVVDARTNTETGGEYFVKWHGVTYDEGTWETRELVMELGPEKITQFEERTSRDYTSDKTYCRVGSRKQSTPLRIISEQPSYIVGGKLRDFQLAGINFMIQNWSRGRNTILADEMGLGKTVQTVALIQILMNERNLAGPFLIVAPLSTIPAWAETFNFWAPAINYVVYQGNAKAREIIAEKEIFHNRARDKTTKVNVVLTTPEMVREEKSWQPLTRIAWQGLVVDEAHNLKNRDSRLYEVLMGESFIDRLLITGTPIQNNFKELGALMQFLMPGEDIFDGIIDLSAETASADIEALQHKISPYIIRRTKVKVEKDLPKKTEKIIRVPMAEVQRELYTNILEKNYTALKPKDSGPQPSLLNVHGELRKVSNHPLVFPHVYDELAAKSTGRADWLQTMIATSGKMYLIDKLLTKLHAEGHRVLIFSQSVKMLDILSDYMQLKGTRFQRLDGTTPASQRQKAIDHFNAEGSDDTSFLLSTRAGGLGINLMTADTVIIFDSDYNPQMDLQAMSRAHRIGQQKHVTVYRIISADTIDEEVVQTARAKLILEHITIQQGVSDKDPRVQRAKRMAQAPNEKSNAEDINRLLKARSQKLFEQRDKDSKELENMDIDAVLENAEIDDTAHMDGMSVNDQEDFLNNFVVVDVDVDWDDIIPKDVRDAVEDEERRIAEEKATQELIAQNAPRIRKPAGDKNAGLNSTSSKRASAMKATAMLSPSEDEDEADEDPKRPLTNREWGRLVAAYKKLGFPQDKPQEVLREAKLSGRDLTVINNTFNDMYDMAEQKVKEELETREAAARDAGKKLRQADSKTAVKFDHKGLQVSNAKTLLERGPDLRAIRDAINSVEKDVEFRMPVTPQAKTHFTVDWDLENDNMLLVGVARHGYGSWDAIKFDAELNLKDKIFLQDSVDKVEAGKGHGNNIKSPGPMHLSRRTDYLVLLLKSHSSGGTDEVVEKQLQNHHRNLKKDKEQVVKKDREPAAKKKDTTRLLASPAGHTAAQAAPKKRSPALSKPPEDSVGDREEGEMVRFFSSVAGELNEINKRPAPEPTDRQKKAKDSIGVLWEHIEGGKSENASEDLKLLYWQHAAATWFQKGKGEAIRKLGRVYFGKNKKKPNGVENSSKAAKDPATSAGTTEATSNGHNLNNPRMRSNEALDVADEERRKRRQSSPPGGRNGHTSERPRKRPSEEVERNDDDDEERRKRQRRAEQKETKHRPSGSSSLSRGPNLTRDSFNVFGSLGNSVDRYRQQLGRQGSQQPSSGPSPPNRPPRTVHDPYGSRPRPKPPGDRYRPSDRSRDDRRR